MQLDLRGEARRRGRFARLRLALVVVAAVTGCALPGDGRPPPPPAEASAGSDSDVARTLANLGEQALREGDLALARRRLERALVASPRSVAARVGMGRLALARGEDARARDWFDQALVRDPHAVGALLGAAAVERRRGGDLDRARALLSRARDLAPRNPEVHAEFATLTGRAPPARATDAPALAARASRYPYDPAAAFAAGRALAEAGDAEAAIAQLENAAWLADLHPEAGFAAAKLLAQLDAGWRGRHLIPVRIFADEGLRAHPGWEFRLRSVWKRLSQVLDPVLHLRFLPASVAAFDTGGEANELGAMLLRFSLATQRAPSGILAAFTARSPPKRVGRFTRGLAEFLGRRLLVRFANEPRGLRTLAHEVLHLFGAIHVVDDIDSIMNAGGAGLGLDSFNVQIVRSLRNRRFLPEGPEVNIDAQIDVRQTVDAYLAALRVNLLFRKAGIQDLLEAREYSRARAAAMARRAKVLDPHLADVSRFVARLLLRDGRPIQGIYMLESAARLYGLQTRRGREVERRARRLRAVHLGVNGPP